MIDEEQFENDNFDVKDFIDRLTSRTFGGGIRDGPGAFDPTKLHDAFVASIEQLKIFNERKQNRIDKLEAICQKETKEHVQKVVELQKNHQAAFSSFSELDDRINYVATKVVHLGDQLEGVNIPRTRAAEAQKLMNYFEEFMSEETLSDTFSNPAKLAEAADEIQKLNLVVQDLPNDKFKVAHERIADTYNEVENNLIREFQRAHQAGEKTRMKEMATLLVPFKGYSHCINAFIEQSQKHQLYRDDIFEDIFSLCTRVYDLIKELFSDPEKVMSKFVLNIYHGRLQELVKSRLASKSDLERYLSTLYELYLKTNKLSFTLSEYKLGSDAGFLNKLTKHIFQSYLETYISDETEYLRTKCRLCLQRFYEQRNHQKKLIPTGGIHDLQAKMRDKGIAIGPTPDNYGGEIFLSKDFVARDLLHVSKQAFKRCEVLSSHSDPASNAIKIFNILIEYVCIEHINYAIEIGLQAIPPAETKSPPQIYFFDVVHETNHIFHLLEKQFNEQLVALVISTPRHSEALQKKREIESFIEAKLDSGMDRSLTVIINWIKNILSTEQKKQDFRPDSDYLLVEPYTSTCKKVCAFVRPQIQKICGCLDGKNVEAMLSEFGIRYHRAIYEHLLQFTYNSQGAMLAICDVNEYRKCISKFELPLVSSLFAVLHALCNLLVVKPANMKQVATGEQLADVDKSVIEHFVQLRSDYKAAKIGKQF